MQFEQQEEHDSRHITPHVGEPPEGQHREEYRGLHKDPSEPVAHGRAPFGIVKFAIARVNEEEGYKNRQCGHCHH